MINTVVFDVHCACLLAKHAGDCCGMMGIVFFREAAAAQGRYSCRVPATHLGPPPNLRLRNQAGSVFMIVEKEQQLPPQGDLAA